MDALGQLCSCVLGSRSGIEFLRTVFTAVPQAGNKAAHLRRLVEGDLRALRVAGHTHQGYSQIVWIDPERQVSGKQVSPPPHSSAIPCCLGAYEE